MKISNTFTFVFLSIFVAGCANKAVNQKTEINKIETDKLTALKQSSEDNNPFVINARKQLQRFVGDKNFDNYITKNGILQCGDNSKQSECVLNFYLTEYYKLKSDMQVKKAVADTQINLSKLDSNEKNIAQYCQLSADFINALYTKSQVQSMTSYEQTFKLDEQALSSLKMKIAQDNYAHFLISENPTVAQEMKTEYLQKCLVDPQNTIINYSTIFK